TLTEQDMESETVIVVRDTSTHSERLSKGVIESTPQWVVNDFAAKQRILCSGTGWGRMPAHLISDDLKQGKLIALNQQAFQSMRVPIKIVRKKEPEVGEIAQQLWSQLQDIAWELQKSHLNSGDSFSFETKSD
ncbi:MAG: LysR substrate-binding domain-containing protein, partial [Ghiorsea sp.]